MAGGRGEGNSRAGWRRAINTAVVVPAGHTVELELAQSDAPFFQINALPSVLTVSDAQMVLPTRNGQRPAGSLVSRWGVGIGSQGDPR